MPTSLTVLGANPMRKNRQGLGLGFFVLVLAIVLISTYIDNTKAVPGLVQEKSVPGDAGLLQEWQNPLNNISLVDNREVYARDHASQVDSLYVIVLPPAGDGAISFAQLNNTMYNPQDGYTGDSCDPVVQVYFSADYPERLDVSRLKPNATMELRGQSARLEPQKSYKIKMFESTQPWLGFDNINLNKHFDDESRIRNKLSFDYFKRIPDFVSMRTRFVKLYIRDLSSGTPDRDYKSYGLFTFIEQPNKKYLESHGLDRNGCLYKAENFEFFRYPDSIKPKDHPAYDQAEFDRILEAHRAGNHDKLIEMLDAVNDYNRDINEVVDKYFDRNNLLTWLAVNILLDNNDTNSRNFMLYSPLYSDRWFFIPWDYDKGLTVDNHRGRWQRGLSNYWGMVLFNRLFRYPGNVDDLSGKIEELSEIVNEDNTRRLLDSYYDVARKNVLVPPDSTYLGLTASQYAAEYYSVAGLTELNRKHYHASLENPMPFYLGDVVYQNGSYAFEWDASYDLQNDHVFYSFELSKDPRFERMVAAYNDLIKTECRVGGLRPGDYYWRVTACDSKGNRQHGFDYCKDTQGNTLYGVKRFAVSNINGVNDEGEGQ